MPNYQPTNPTDPGDAADLSFSVGKQKASNWKCNLLCPNQVKYAKLPTMREETLAEFLQKINNLIRLTHLSLDLTLPVEVNPKAIQAMRKRQHSHAAKSIAT